MRPRTLDAEIDRLYQLPLEQFTTARNELARGAGADASEVKRLQKPPLAAWAVNQLFWQDRAVYDDLVEAATALRTAHKAVLGGKRADLRAATQVHDESLDRALKGTLDLLSGAGHKVTEGTRQAILNTLRALPSTDPPGRLARTLQPGGFELLSGFQIAPPKAAPPEPKPPARAPKGSGEDRAAAAKRRTAARQAVAEASREFRDAETEVRRQEFAAARAVKEAERAATRLEQTREALAAAEREVADAERAAAAADNARERGQRDVKAAETAVNEARARLEEAQRALEELSE